MKLALTCILLLTSILGFAQNNPCDSIVWRADRPLTWEDYKGRPDTNTRVASTTNSGFVRTWEAKGYTLRTVMVTTFYPCLSWSKNKASARLLRHEQIHFDITEYFKRLYYKRIAEATYSPATLPGLMKSIYQNILTESQAMQQEYDLQTTHSLNAEQQAAWEQKVAGLLASLKAWDKYELIVELPRR